MKIKKMLVVSSHALDFVWRAGGTIASYTRNGWEIKVICLTFGERGESDPLWQSTPGINDSKVKEMRRKESKKAAKILGVSSIDFFDWGDHLLICDRDRILEIAKLLKEYRPSIIITQFEKDSINFDHEETAKAVFKAVRCAGVSGVYPELPKLKMPAIYMYDPSQPEFFGFKPNVFIDITEIYNKKVEAMSVTSAQDFLIETYKARAKYRAKSARTFSGDKSINYAEAFVSYFPYVGKNFF